MARSFTLLLVLVVVLMFQSTRSSRSLKDHPYNIAHRGASGEIPEESTFAYKRAIEAGADFLEADIGATKDGHLICFHDIILDGVTDVADHPEFSSKRNTYIVDGVNITGFFTVDFTLAEIKTLTLRQRYSYRDQSYNGEFQIITFAEFIAIALSADRTVGIYPEIKSPVFYNEHIKWSRGRIFEDVFLETLKRYGYYGKYLSKNWMRKPLFIQSFAPSSLVYIANKTDSPKVLLLGSGFTSDTYQTFEELTSDSYLDYIQTIITGIGPPKEAILPVDDNNKLLPATDLVDKAHIRGLQVHPWTFHEHLPFDYHQDPYLEYDELVGKIGVDGVFTDFAQTFQNYRQKWALVL